MSHTEQEGAETRMDSRLSAEMKALIGILSEYYVGRTGLIVHFNINNQNITAYHIDDTIYFRIKWMKIDIDPRDIVDTAKFLIDLMEPAE